MRMPKPSGSRSGAEGAQVPSGGAKQPQHRTWADRVGTKAFPYLMTLPLVLIIVILALYPTWLTLSQSFYHVDPLDPPERFVGLKNYADVLSNVDVTNAWTNTFIYAVFGVALTTLAGLCMALALRRPFRGRGLVLAAMILPWALPGIVEGIIWNWIYDPTFGVLNSVLSQLHLIGQYQLWISGNRIVSIFFIEIVQVWQVAPLAAILMLASLQNIPEDLHDAASIDGAGWWSELWSMTLPLIRPGIAIAVIQALIASLNIFDQVYVLNGNATTSVSVMMQTYMIAFQNLNFGQGYAISFILTILTMGISVVALRFIYRKVEF
jgi:multiple sugar transport system permease protein